MSQIDGLRNGFESLGVETYAGYSYLNGSDMAYFVEAFKPDLILEINRTRNQIEDFAENIFHVSWTWDHVYPGKDIQIGFGGSQINYFLVHPSAYSLEEKLVEPWRYLFPGVDEKIYQPREVNWLCDSSIIGFLSGPISAEELNSPITVGGKALCKLSDIYEVLLKSNILELDNFFLELRQLITSFLQKYEPRITGGDIPLELMVFFQDRYVRTVHRVNLLSSLTDTSKNLRFYGYGGWLDWPKLAQHYYGPVYTQSQKAEIYNGSLTHIHHAGLMHDRVMETLASGTICLTKGPIPSFYNDSLDVPLISGEDFIEYTGDTLTDVLRETLADSNLRSGIRQRARKKIIQGHTWRHRAAQILDDISSLR